MSAKVEGIELQITSDASSAAAGLNKLATSLFRVKDAGQGFSLSTVANNLKKLGESIQYINVETLSKVADTLERIKEATSGGAMKISLNAKSIAAASKAVEEARSAGLVDAPGKTETITPKETMTEEAGPNGQDGFLGGITSSVRNIGKEAKKATSSIEKLGAAIKRIAIYRAIRAAIKAITQAFKEGTQNAYQYSKAIAGPLAKNMDAIATSALFLKNGLGAAVAPIINALTPAITALADGIAYLGNAIAGMIAKLTGQATYIKAIKNMTAYADATAGAAKAQKQLLGFDELNVLTDRGGSGGTSVDYSKMFETVNTSSFKLGDVWQEILKTVNTVTTKIGGAFKGVADAMGKIDWSSLPSKIFNGIRQVIEAVNWPELFSGIGQFIGAALGEAISFIAGGHAALRQKALDWINEQLAGVGEDATVQEKGVAIVAGILAGIVKGLVNVGTWIWTNVVSPILGGVLDGFKKTAGPIWDEVSFELRYLWATAYGWWTLQKEAFFTSSVWDKVFAPIWKALATAVEKIKEIWGNVQTWLDEHGLNFKVELPQIQLGETLANLVTGGSNKRTRGGTLGGIFSGPFADGGYPAMGSLFYAGEAGPELVSNINGRTGVINNDQFGAMIMAAADNIINAVLASGQGIAGAVEANKPEFNINGRQLARVMYPEMEREGQRIGPSAVSVV